MRRKIAIFCGGPSSEHEVSINSAKTIQEHIDKKKYEPYIFYISKNLKTILTPCDKKIDFEKLKPKIDLIENLKLLKENNFFAFLGGIHGEFVEDGRLQSLLDFFKIPYSGSDFAASSLAMNKFKTALIAKNIKGVNLPKTVLLNNDCKFPNHLKFPIIIKPNSMGSSVGVSVLNSISEYSEQINKFIKKYPSQEILLQEYFKNAIEIQSGTLQKINGDFVEIPPIEIIPNKNVFFDYDSKYKIGGAKEITPPVGISKKLSDKIAKISIELHKLLKLKTYSRNDFLVVGKKIYFLEVNTLPGMTATSLLPQEAKAAGIEFTDLIDFIITNS